MRTCGWYPMKVLCSQEVVRHIAVGLYSVRALRRRLRLRCHGVSPACSSSKVFGRIRPGQKLLIFMRFHAVLFGNQHEMWSKQHNGKVREIPQVFPVLRGLWVFYALRAELQTALEVGEQLLRLAQSVQDSAFLLEAYRSLGTTLFHLG